jgi:hypothetical protein
MPGAQGQGNHREPWAGRPHLSWCGGQCLALTGDACAEDVSLNLTRRWRHLL